MQGRKSGVGHHCGHGSRSRQPRLQLEEGGHVAFVFAPKMWKPQNLLTCVRQSPAWSLSARWRCQYSSYSQEETGIVAQATVGPHARPSEPVKLADTIVRELPGKYVFKAKLSDEDSLR